MPRNIYNSYLPNLDFNVFLYTLIVHYAKRRIHFAGKI